MSAYGKKDLPQGKWDLEEYEKQGRERQQAEYERRKNGGRVERPTDGVEATARAARVDIYEGLNQVTLVPAGASVGRRGKGAGFYCEVCDLTFKDSLQYLDHINSKQHLYASGQTENTRQATLEDVRARLAFLRQKLRDDNIHKEYDINQRIALRRKLEEEEREQRRAKRAERRKRKNGGVGEEEVNMNTDMAAVMGFGGFGSSKR